MTHIVGTNPLPIAGDTGRVNISHLMHDGWRGQLHVQKVGPIVFLTGASLRPPSTGTVELCQLPDGFYPSSTRMSEGVEGSSFRAVFIINGAVQIRGISAANSYLDLNAVFTTTP